MKGNKGDIVFRTGSKRPYDSGRIILTWHGDALSPYTPGTDLKKYMNTASVSTYLKRAIKY